jgi:hypothetical protein
MSSAAATSGATSQASRSALVAQCYQQLHRFISQVAPASALSTTAASAAHPRGRGRGNNGRFSKLFLKKRVFNPFFNQRQGASPSKSCIPLSRVGHVSRDGGRVLTNLLEESKLTDLCKIKARSTCLKNSTIPVSCFTVTILLAPPSHVLKTVF